jgi:hypothetical protein
VGELGGGAEAFSHLISNDEARSSPVVRGSKRFHGIKKWKETATEEVSDVFNKNL